MTNFDLSVRNPVTHNTWDNGRFTSYEIAIDTTNKAFCLPHSACRRRYSEFVWLCKRLKSRHPLISPPSLPPKSFFRERFDHDFIAFRMKGLEDFLHKLLNEKLYMSDSGVHLFLQTNLTCQQIDDFMSGKISDEDIDSIWKAGGIKEQSSAFGEESFEDLSEDFLPKGNNLVQNDDKLSECSSLMENEEYRCEFSTSSSSAGDDTDFPSVSLVSGYLSNNQDKLNNDTISQTSSKIIQAKMNDTVSQASSQVDSGISSCGEILESDQENKIQKPRTSSPLDSVDQTLQEDCDLIFQNHSNEFSIN